MKNLMLVLFLFGVEFAQAVPVAINRQDVKFPTQQMVEKQVFVDPIASSTTRIVTNTAGATSAAIASLTSFSAQPDMARNLEITPAGVTGDIESCDITVTGTDYLSNTISEVFHFDANATGKQIGADAFKTVTAVQWAASCESGSFGAVWSIGVGEKLGLKRCMGNAADILFSVAGTSKEGTAPTIASASTRVSSNTADFNGTMNSSTDFILYFFQNFRCF